MKQCMRIWTALMVLGATPVLGAFTYPTQEQLQAAARNPSLVAPLLKDAGVDEAALIAKDVLIEIVKLDLEPDDRESRIRALIDNLFTAMPENHKELVIALGKAVAASPTASISPDVVSNIQLAVIMATDVLNGSAFGNAYNLAMQTVAGAPGGGKTTPSQPPPPPVALPYEIQTLE
ncbi:MAG: hypothetical protein GX548_08700 [Lentisphaerae bacterium]|nr:hypothetical protein [Lentisphaerota bacterium]